MVVKQTTITSIHKYLSRQLGYYLKGARQCCCQQTGRTLARSVDLAAGEKPFFKKQRNFTVNVGGLDALTLVLKKRYYNEARGVEIKEKQRRNIEIAKAKRERKKRKLEEMSTKSVQAPHPRKEEATCLENPANTNLTGT